MQHQPQLVGLRLACPSLENLEIVNSAVTSSAAFETVAQGTCSMRQLTVSHCRALKEHNLYNIVARVRANFGEDVMKLIAFPLDVRVTRDL